MAEWIKNVDAIKLEPPPVPPWQRVAWSFFPFDPEKFKIVGQGIGAGINWLEQQTMPASRWITGQINRMPEVSRPQWLQRWDEYRQQNPEFWDASSVPKEPGEPGYGAYINRKRVEEAFSPENIMEKRGITPEELEAEILNKGVWGVFWTYILPSLTSRLSSIRVTQQGLTPDKARSILGVGKNATRAEMNTAFRKLAFKYHPDTSTVAGAGTKFNEAAAAYDLLTKNLTGLSKTGMTRPTGIPSLASQAGEVSKELATPMVPGAVSQLPQFASTVSLGVPDVTGIEQNAIKTYGVVAKLSPYQGSYILKDGRLLDLDDAGHRELGVNEFGRQTGGLRLRVTPEEVNIDFISDRNPTPEQMKQIHNLVSGKKVTYSIVDNSDNELVGSTKVSFNELEKGVNEFYKPAIPQTEVGIPKVSTVSLGVPDVTKTASQRIESVTKNIVASVKQVPPKQPPVTTFETRERLPSRATKAVRQFLTRTYRPQRIFEYIDGGKWGPVTDSFYGTMDKARSTIYQRVTNDLGGMRQAMVENGLKYPDMLKSKQIIYNAEGQKFSLDLDQRIGVYIYSQNARAMNHLKGMGLDKAAVTQIITSLTPQEGAYAQWLMKDMQRLEPEVAQVTQNVLGKKFSPVDHYFRLMVSESDVIDMPVKVPTVGGFAPEKAVIPKGFTKARKGSFEQVRLRATEIYVRHMQQAENFIQMQPVARDLGRLLHKPEILSMFRNARMPLHKAEDLTKIVHDWIVDSTSTNPNAPRNYLEKVVRTFRVNAVTAVLGFNVVTSMKQFPSFVTGATEIGVIPAIKGLFKFMSNPGETKELIKTYSPQIYKRVIEREIKEMETIKGIIAGKLSKRQIAMFFTTSMDKLAVGGLWRGGFDDYLTKNPERFEGAAKYVENAIKKTQPIYEAKDLAALWRTGELGKVFTMFQNQLNQNWNYLIFDVMGKAKMGTISKAEATRRVFLAFVIPGLLIGLIAKSRLPKKGKDFAGDLTDQIIANVPIFGAMILSALRGYDVSPGIAFEPFQQAGYAVGAIQKMVKEPSTEQLIKTVRQTLIAIGYLTGTPTGQIKRAADTLIKQAEGNLDDWMEYVWGSYIRGQSQTKTPKPTVPSELRKYLPPTQPTSHKGIPSELQKYLR